MTEQQLVDLKKKIDSAKREQSELKGRKKALLENLQNTWGCKTVEEAEKKASSLQKQIDKLEEEKEKGIKEIEETYEF